MDFFTCLSVIFSQSFSLVGRGTLCRFLVRLCRSRGSFTISVFWALCTSATNIVGLLEVSTLLIQNNITCSSHHAFCWNWTTTRLSYFTFSLKGISWSVPRNITGSFMRLHVTPFEKIQHCIVAYLQSSPNYLVLHHTLASVIRLFSTYQTGGEIDLCLPLI